LNTRPKNVQRLIGDAQFARQEREKGTGQPGSVYGSKQVASRESGQPLRLGGNYIGIADASGSGINEWYQDLAVNSVSVNAITGSSSKRKGKEVEIAKDVFRRRARAKEKLPHVRGQKNTAPRSNRRGDGPAENMDIDASGDEQDKLGT
jgi:hypothetical protein